MTLIPTTSSTVTCRPLSKLWMAIPRYLQTRITILLLTNWTHHVCTLFTICQFKILTRWIICVAHIDKSELTSLGYTIIERPLQDHNPRRPAAICLHREGTPHRRTAPWKRKVVTLWSGQNHVRNVKTGGGGGGKHIWISHLGVKIFSAKTDLRKNFMRWLLFQGQQPEAEARPKLDLKSEAWWGARTAGSLPSAGCQINSGGEIKLSPCVGSTAP